MPEMSWLSPKRRRTTGNLKTLPNGQDNSDAPLSSTPKAAAPRSERPPLNARPVSQPSAGIMRVASDGNLFYAYARRDDESRSRFLLTFASASIANEWWHLVREYFPDCTRPGPQLFSFKTEDLLSKAWKHSALEPLKSKWMYISLSDTSSSVVGGAAQGIIPVQDEQGNMLGGTPPASPEILGHVRRETKIVKNELSKLEEHFERMVEAMERNTDSVKKLAERQLQPETPKHDQGSYFDSTDLATHFGRLTDLLQRNTEYVENLSKKQFENEQKLRVALEDVAAKQRADYLDMSQLSTHLDRIQKMMETSNHEHQEKARESATQQQETLGIDFTPLTSKLGNIQEAVEQNSALIKALLEDAAATESKPSTPFWGKESPEKMDWSPLTEHLQKIQDAIEQQNAHMQALVGFASGGDDPNSASGSGEQQSFANLSPLGEHLEQIYNAIEEGNRQAKAREDNDKGSDFAPITRHLEAIHTSSKQLLNAQQATRSAIEKGRASTASNIDLTPLTGQLEAIRQITVSNGEHVRSLLEAPKRGEQHAIDLTPLTSHLESIKTAIENNAEIDFTPLAEHFDAMQSATEKHSEYMRSMLDAQEQRAVSIDLTPLTERLNRIHTSLENGNTRDLESSSGTGDAKFIMAALASHLSKIQAITEQNAGAVKAMREKQVTSQDQMHAAIAQTSGHIRALAQRGVMDEKRIDATESQIRELMAGQREMVNVMRELAQSITAQNKGACDHVVIPPPRKVGRKIVGFVYDANNVRYEE